MPSKTKLKIAAIAAKTAALLKIPKGLIDQFVSGDARTGRERGLVGLQDGAHRARNGRRAGPPPGLPGRRETQGRGQVAKWQERQDGIHR